MRRRDFLAGTASVAAFLAGCSSNSGTGGPEESEGGNSETEDSGLLEPSERDYRNIEYGENVAEEISSRAHVAEEKTDHLVFNDYSKLLEREESYVEISDEGVQSVVREADEEQVEQDLYGLEINVGAKQQIKPEKMQEFAVDALEGIAPVIHQGFYDSTDEIPDKNPISNLTIEVEGDNSYGQVSYGMPSETLGGDSIEDFGETVLTYLEEGEESTAIEESVEENFQYAVE